jgi:hypothetical protein
MKIQFSKNFEKILKESSAYQAFETESFYDSLDLISEGPIEGLVNSDGQTLNYIDLGFNDINSLSYGVYYNDVVVRDKKTNLYNFTSSSIDFTVGNQIKNSVSECKAIYEYKTKLYDISFGAYRLAAKENLTLPVEIPPEKTNVKITNDFFASSSMNATQQGYAKYRNYSRPFSHYIKNKYCTSVDVNIGVDSLFSVDDKGNTLPLGITFIINVSNLTQREDFYFLFNSCFVAKGGTVVLPFNITIEDIDKKSSLFPELVINIYSLRSRLGSDSESLNKTRSFYVDSVTEKIDYPFSYPYSVLCKNKISSKHFNAIPVRSYDCKLLKIQIPDNYDGEIREYDGDWSGSFGRTLKWTNNPAWIFYDLCTNSRYGMARGQLNESDLNKWQLLTLSKYCDELIVTNVSTKYEPDIFYFNNDLKYGDDNFNTVTFSTTQTEAQIQEKYPFGYTLYLYDIKNESAESINVNYKKVILSATVSNGTATLKLCNDFGPRKVLENDLDGNLFKAILNYVQNSTLNVEDKIKSYIAGYFSGSVIGSLPYSSEDQRVSISYTSKPIFDNSLNIKYGYCVAKHPDYKEFLENRFSCNLVLNSENEGLKALTDLSSIFRGIFYFKNGLLNLTTDVLQDPIYIFTNSNVKDGLFSYSSGDLNNIFTVAKVTYSDKTDNFKDKIIYVEDSQMIKKFGIVEKEILGLGITSKTEAQRVGKWYLATGKLESEIVNFITGFEASVLQIGNVVRISDSLKTASVVYGKVTSLDFKNQYIYIDREVPENCLGQVIKIFSIINNKPLELNFSVSEVDNSNLRLKIINSTFTSWNVVSNIIVSDTNRTLTASSTSGSSWNKKAFTNQSHIDNCQISFKFSSIVKYASCGISQISETYAGPSPASYSDVNYSFVCKNTSLLSIYENGTQVGSDISPVSIDDVLQITYDGENVKYYQNKTLLRTVARSKGAPLYGVVALFEADAQINSIYFSRFPEISYGAFSSLRSDANFAVYLNENDSDHDLYRIVNINEASSNEYAVTAMKYSKEKFNIIEKNEYVDNIQNNKKQVVFSTDNEINEAFDDTIISLAIKIAPISYVSSINHVYDYSFYVENEVLNKQYYDNAYEELTIDFNFLFSYLQNIGSTNVFGLMCIIKRNGKTLNFNILRDGATKVNIFLGETPVGDITSKTNLDFYAFDSNYKLINV